MVNKQTNKQQSDAVQSHEPNSSSPHVKYGVSFIDSIFCEIKTGTNQFRDYVWSLKFEYEDHTLDHTCLERWNSQRILEILNQA